MSAKSNKTVLSFAIEDSIGVLPGTPDWTSLEWNDLTNFGSTISTVSRTPVNQDLMEYEGAVSDLDSAVAFQTDLTYSSFNNFAQGAFYSVWKAQSEFTPTDVTATGFTVGAAGDLADGILFFTRGYSDPLNNGLFVSALSTTLEIKPSGGVVEAVPALSARLDVVGVQGAAGDIEMDISGNLTSTILDFTTLGIKVGQSIFIGGSTAITQFDNALYTGLARVRSVAAGLITLDKRDWVIGAADSGGVQTIQIFIGSFIRNVAQDHADFLEESYTFEADIDGATEGKIYEYPEGSKLNTMTLDFPLTDKAGLGLDFIGTDTPDPVNIQATGNRLNTYEAAAFGTTSDFARLSLKDSGLSDYSTTFKSLSIEINRQVSAEKTIGKLGANDMNIGTLMITGSSSVIYNDSNIVKAARGNETTTLDFAVINSDGCLHFDIPAMKFENVNKSFPVNESVLLDVAIKTFKDNFFGYVMSVTKYPFLPIS